MKVVIAGGSGMIGRALTTSLLSDGHTVVVLSRRPSEVRDAIPAGATVDRWSADDIDALAGTLAGADAVVNLAGASVGPRRWTKARKRTILSSRVEPTRAIVTALAILTPARRPPVLVSASGTDGYTRSDGLEVTEATPMGGGFLADVCRAWEGEAFRAADLGVRVVILRIGPVVTRQATSLRLLALPIRLGLGGRLGSGDQWISWIHLADLIGVTRRVIDDATLEGVINVVSTEPVRQIVFARSLARRLHRPLWLRLPAWLLRTVLGEGVDVVLGSRRVKPARLLEAGYAFRFPTLDAALEEALA